MVMSMGAFDGIKVGTSVGALVGSKVGKGVGRIVPGGDGLLVEVGVTVGLLVVGVAVGFAVAGTCGISILSLLAPPYVIKKISTNTNCTSIIFQINLISYLEL